MAHQDFNPTRTIPAPPATVLPDVALPDVFLSSGSDAFPSTPRDVKMTPVDFAVEEEVVDAARPASDTSVSVTRHEAYRRRL